MRPLLRSALLPAAFVLAACGGGGSTPGTGGPTQPSGGPSAAPLATTVAGGVGNAHACALLSDDDVRQATGYEVGAKVDASSQLAYTNGCLWTLKGVAWRIVLGIQSPGGRTAYDRLATYTETTPIDGLADAAVHVDISDSLLAVSGDTLVDLQWVAVGEPADVERKLAERILANLPD